MKRFFTLATLCTLILGIPAMGADEKSGKKKNKKKDAVDAPQFPKQPYLNSALKALTRAQQAFNGSNANSQEVIGHLQAAVEKLGPMKSKGPYPADCSRFTEQAIKHLQTGQTDKVANDIAQALKAGIRAGEVGSRSKQ